MWVVLIRHKKDVHVSLLCSFQEDYKGTRQASEKPCQTKLLLVNNCQKPKNEKEKGIILCCIGGTSPCVKFRIITLTC